MSALVIKVLIADDPGIRPLVPSWFGAYRRLRPTGQQGSLVMPRGQMSTVDRLQERCAPRNLPHRRQLTPTGQRVDIEWTDLPVCASRRELLGDVALTDVREGEG